MYSRILYFIACLWILPRVRSYSIASGPRRRPPPTTTCLQRLSSQQSSWRLALSSKEDEIRELEEKLQKLKQEAVEEESAVVEEEIVNLNEQAVYTELLTEQWKEDEAGEAGEGGFLKSVGVALATIGLLVGLALFSQVPIGQEDLSRYSTPNRAPSTQIDLGDLNRARQSGDV